MVAGGKKAEGAAGSLDFINEKSLLPFEKYTELSNCTAELCILTLVRVASLRSVSVDRCWRERLKSSASRVFFHKQRWKAKELAKSRQPWRLTIHLDSVPTQARLTSPQLTQYRSTEIAVFQREKNKNISQKSGNWVGGSCKVQYYLLFIPYDTE